MKNLLILASIFLSSFAASYPCSDLAKQDLQFVQSTLAQLTAEFETIPADPSSKEWVAKKIHYMASLDRTLRRAVFKTMTEHDYTLGDAKCVLHEIVPTWTKVSVANTESLRGLTATYSWFSKSEFGPTVNHEAALVAQSISDITLQQVILIRMKAMLSPNEVTADDYANLFDRVKLEQSQKEVYGTQGQCRGHGTWGISNDDFSIEDLKNLDERRKEIGLDSFSQQQVRLGRFCYVPGGQPFED